MTHTIELTPPTATPEFGSARLKVSERHGQGLLGWIQPTDVRPAYYALPVTSPIGVEDFVAGCASSCNAKPATSLVPIANQAVRPLPGAVAEQAAQLSGTAQFRIAYQPFGATFASARLADLVTPEWWVDSAYVDDLVGTVPGEGDLCGLFDFCFPNDELPPPMLVGTNAAAFASAHPCLNAPGPIRIARCAPGKVTFEFDVTPRPNWTWLATIAGSPRLVILNGVHHLLALLKAGRKEAFCLMRAAQSPLDLQANGLNFMDPLLFKPGELMSARPPLLRDYLDDTVAAPVSRHATDQQMRVVVQNEIIMMPRIQ